MVTTQVVTATAAVEGLKRLGFSENEAKVYIALMQHPGVTGYEVSRYSGVPRAKVYEVLEGLVERGAVLPETGEDRTLYRSRSFTALLQEHRRSTDFLLAELYRELSGLQAEESRPATVSVTGRDRALARAAELIGTARNGVLAAGRPEELQQLGPQLADAERRGVAVRVLSRGPVRLNLQEVHVEAGRREDQSLAVVADQVRVCLVDLTQPGDAYGLTIDARGIAVAVAGWVRREMAIGELDRMVAERLGDLLPAAALQHLQRLWRT